MKKIITNSEKETFQLGSRLAKKSKGGEVYALFGDLGAGKTVFVRGFCAGLGIKKGVNSPTFVLMKVYPVRGNKKLKEVCHIDAYRLKGESDLEAIGALDYFRDKEAVCLVEWAERIKKILPKKTVAIKIKHQKESKREIQIKKT